MITDLNEILVEWAYRTNDGKPDVKNSAKLLTLETVLKDFGWSREARAELLNTLMTEDDIVKNRKTGNVYTVKNVNKDKHQLVKKNASKDDIEKVDKAKEKGDEEKPKDSEQKEKIDYWSDLDKLGKKEREIRKAQYLEQQLDYLSIENSIPSGKGRFRLSPDDVNDYRFKYNIS